MKILHINTVCGYGSTGNIAVEIAEYTRIAGHEAYVAFAHNGTKYAHGIKFGSTIEQKLYAIFARLTGMQGLFGYRSTIQLIAIIDKISPDIVHIHNIHGNTLYFPWLFNYLKQKKLKVIWTLHDCWSFTGGCSHFTRYGCFKFQKECNYPCSSYRSWLPFGKAKRLNTVYNKKRDAFTSIDKDKLKIVTVSSWLNKTVKHSFLKKYEISTIYNWINTDIFQYRYDKTTFVKYNLDPNKKYLVSVSALWSDTGTTKLNDALRLVAILPEEYQILIIGNLETSRTLPANMTYIPYVNGALELSKLYSIAFAYLNFSIEDTFGKVIAEAMACGTPTVVFDSTACGEVVGDVGIKVPSHDVQAILDALTIIGQTGKEAYIQTSIDYVRSNFAPMVSLSKYLDIYNSFL